MKANKVVVCITTHNRVDCARINMEIIKYNYQKKWLIVHACSNDNYQKYIEDILIKCPPKPLQEGAFNLLKHSWQAAHEKFSPDYIVHIEADTWLMNQVLIENYINKLDLDKDAVISGSSWSFDKSYKWKQSKSYLKRIKYFTSILTKSLGFSWHIGWKNSISTQYFIAKNTPRLRKLILESAGPAETEYLEKYLFSKINNEFGRKAFLWMKEREPVHPKYRESCEALELFCSHLPSNEQSTGSKINNLRAGKKQTLQKYFFLQKGPHMQKLLESKSFGYYNLGAKHEE